MQIDFHHAVTYVLARLAGFGHREAETVAHCAQYVDDATNSGTIGFDNGAMYSRISSAHKILDYRNFEKLANHFVWIPFHFLPGNSGLKAGEDPEGSFIHKLICRPNSPVAKDMNRTCIVHRNTRYGLHRLGITLHVYADTWAHQGFAGVNHAVNDIRTLDDSNRPDPDFIHKINDFFGDVFDNAASRFVGGALALGHGPALSYPDRPYLKWRYKDSRGTIIERDNTNIFVEAAHEICKVMQQFRAGSPEAAVPGLLTSDRERIAHLLATITDDKGSDRHQKWLQAISAGYFDFPPVKLDYRAKGLNSWKHQALGTRKVRDKKNEPFPYSPSFLRSDWKLFHDALMAHRFSVIRDILPRYGICAA